LPLTSIQEFLGTASNAPPLPNGFQPIQQSPNNPRRGGSSISLLPDQFLGDEPMEAAKKYMRSVGHAVPFDEIADAVKGGGGGIRGADWRDRLEISLKRSPYQVVTVADHTYGLADFYSDEQLKRRRNTRRAKEGSSTPTKKKKKPKFSKPN